MLLYLEICDGNMEQGSLRCDANISVRPVGSKKLGVKTEVKNMNSFHGVEKALTYEIDRQIRIIENGGKVRQETLLWDANKNITSLMRTKEESHDYRYFPEPDLVPLNIEESRIDEVIAQLPELPLQKRNRFISQYKLPVYDANFLTESNRIADYYEQVVELVPDPKLVSNWVMSEILHIMKERQNLDELPISGTALAELLNLMVFSGKSANLIVKEKNLSQISDPDLLSRIISEVIDKNPGEVAKYQTGRTKLFGYFVGQVMQKTQGKDNPHLVNKLLHKKLSSS